MYLGMCNGRACNVSSNSPNQSVCLTGLSGTGKTSRLNCMEMRCVEEGETVIVLDINRTHSDEQIFLPIQTAYGQHVNRINLIDDGLDIDLLKPMQDNCGREEPFVCLINSAVKGLNSALGMGSRQIAALRKATIEASKYRQKFNSDITAIAFFLEKAEDQCSQIVYEKMWTILKCGVFRPSQKKIKAGQINIFDLSGNDTITQTTIAEIILENIWRHIQYEGSYEGAKKIVIVADEFQNLSMKKEAILRTMLHEGRRMGIKTVLATQSLQIFAPEIQSFLSQTATRLYFRPAVNETRRIAKEIGDIDYKKYEKILKMLKIGEALAVGNLFVDGREISRPLILR